MGDFKKEHGKSRFGKFIQKAGGVFPEILDAGIKLASGNVMGALDEVGGILGKNSNHSNPQAQKEATELLNEFQIQREEFALEAFRIESEDRKDARVLYSKDSWIQKALALLFVVGYAVLSVYLLNVLMGSTVIPKLAETMVTMIWTGTSVKLNTIIDFFFGGSIK